MVETNNFDDIPDIPTEEIQAILDLLAQGNRGVYIYLKQYQTPEELLGVLRQALPLLEENDPRRLKLLSEITEARRAIQRKEIQKI